MATPEPSLLAVCSTDLQVIQTAALRGRFFIGGLLFISLDMETYSACDLKSRGLHNYATDDSTGIHCFSWGDDPFEIQTWVEGDPFPEELREHIAKGGVFTAWNAAFEINLWMHCGVRRYGWPKVEIEQWRCSMAQAYAMSLPGSLEKAANALGVAEQKDMKGARIMLQLAQPKADGSMWRPEQDPAKFEQLRVYNRQDVRTELAVRERLMELSDEEQKLWVLDYKINQRGIQIDLPSVNAAIRLVEAEKARLDKEMLKVTGGVVGKCTEVQLLIKWIRTQGVAIEGVAKADVLDALNGDLPASVRAALNLRKEAAKSSTAKLIAMRDRASADGRVRGTMQFHGAHTGRWAHRGIQPGNLPRTRKGIKHTHIEDIIAHLHDREYVDMLYGPVMDAMADSIRGMICAAPNKELISADFSNIEGRVMAWLAGEEWKLQAFRDFDAGTGPDLYKVSYSKSFLVDVDSVDDDQRQVGKVQELSMQFQGGKGAFQNMARIYGVKVSDDEAEAFKVRWREAHPKVVKYWWDHEGAAINAVELGVVCKAGPAGRQVAYKKDGSFLWCRLPSGRVLCYPYPAVKSVEVPWGGTKPALFYWRVNQTTNKWEETSTYGGDLAQSAVQAMARDVMATSMVKAEDVGIATIFTVHDQLIAEVAAGSGETALEELVRIMSQAPAWASGLPVAAEGWNGPRFRK